MRSEDIVDDFKLLIKQIGVNLAKARHEKGVSQRTIVRASGRSPSLVGKVEKYPSVDIALRSIYEVARLIPTSLGEIILKSEKELELHHISLGQPKAIEKRLQGMVDKLAELSATEQIWMADMMEGLLARTSAPVILEPNQKNHKKKKDGFELTNDLNH